MRLTIMGLILTLLAIEFGMLMTFDKKDKKWLWLLIPACAYFQVHLVCWLIRVW